MFRFHGIIISTVARANELRTAFLNSKLSEKEFIAAQTDADQRLCKCSSWSLAKISFETRSQIGKNSLGTFMGSYNAVDGFVNARPLLKN